MIKTARKPSADPVQEKLRQNKALWNKDVSNFINDLINFKKTMNGAPSKFFPEKGNIKEPIPADPATIVGVLANDFQEIAQKGNAIVSEQLNYSKNRRKSQPKAPQATGTTPTEPSPTSPVPATGPDLTTQLAAFEQKYGLIAEGSNPITRFFTRIFNPTVGFGDAAELRRARMAMLNKCADAHYKLEKFQVLVVKSSKDSIPNAYKKLEQAGHDWNLVSRAYNIYKSSKAVSAPDKGGDIESSVKKTDEESQKAIKELDKAVQNVEVPPVAAVPAEVPDPVVAPVANKGYISPNLAAIEQAKRMTADYRKYYEYLPDVDTGGYLANLDRVVDKFIATRYRNLDADFAQFYDKSLEAFNLEYQVNATSFKDLVMQLRDKATTPTVAPIPAVPSPEKIASLYLEKVAQDFLKKWIGKTRHQFSIFDQTSPFRLNSYKEAGEIREDLNTIMNSLEKGLDEETLNPLIKDINTRFITLRGLMTSLHLGARVR